MYTKALGNSQDYESATAVRRHPNREQRKAVDEARSLMRTRIAAVMHASDARCAINARSAQKWDAHARRPYETRAKSSTTAADFGSRGRIWASGAASLYSYITPQRAQHGLSPRSCESEASAPQTNAQLPSDEMAWQPM